MKKVLVVCGNGIASSSIMVSILQDYLKDLDNRIKTYQEVINASGSYLLEKDYIQADYITACIDREKDYPTGLLMSNGIGIAIPHANYQLVKSDAISLVRSSKGVEFGQMEDSDLKVSCQLIFNLNMQQF